MTVDLDTTSWVDCGSMMSEVEVRSDDRRTGVDNKS